MSDRVRPSPWLSLAWEPSLDGGPVCLTLRAPPKRDAYRLAGHEAWLLDLLDHLGATPGSWTRSGVVSIAYARGLAEADADIEATLARLWSLAFEHEHEPDFDEHALVWEQRGWKLALQYLIASLDNPPPARVRPLPPPRELPKLGIEAILHRRRTCRDFSGRPLQLVTLATLLAQATGAAQLPTHLTIHLLIMRIAGLEPGVYRYHPQAHAITLLHHSSTEQTESQLVRTLIGQPYVIGSSAGVLLSSQFDALIFERPADATLRTHVIELGMLAQRLLLSGHAFELDSFLSAAILEHEARALTMGDIDESMSPIHLVAFGGE